MKTCDFPMEVKALTEEGTFEGYGSIFGNVDSYGDKVLPGAFAASLAKHRREGRRIKMLWQHDTTQPIGVWEDVAEDGKGLWGKGRLTLAVQRAKEAHALLKEGALDGLSIGYVATETEPSGNVRLLKQVELYEISPVTFGANSRARVERVKSDAPDRLQEFARRLRDGEPMPIKEFEDILREAGVPKSMAVTIASRGYAHAIRSESGGDEAKQLTGKALADLREAVAGFLPSRT